MRLTPDATISPERLEEGKRALVALLVQPLPLSQLARMAVAVQASRHERLRR